MAITYLALLGVTLLVTFGVQSVRHRLRTGSSGFRGIAGRPGSPEWVGGVLFGVALALAVLAPLAELGGLVAARTLPAPVRAAGWVAWALGFAGTVWAQRAMGDSWRIGVDARERTGLVTTGPFRLVRNPIFGAMLLGSAGLAVLLPNGLAIAAAAVMVAGIELHVRFAEEPYLLATHGDAWARYAARTGRFVPGLGRLRRRVP